MNPFVTIPITYAILILVAFLIQQDTRGKIELLTGFVVVSLLAGCAVSLFILLL
jgi:hypothetical protein